MSEKVDIPELDTLISGVRTELPIVQIDTDKPEKDDGSYRIFFFYGGIVVEVEWKPSTGFGVYAEEQVYGEGPQEVFAHSGEAVINVVSRLKGEHFIQEE